MKTIPPILITVLAVFLGVRMNMNYDETPLGIFMIVTFFFMIILTNLSLPSLIPLFNNKEATRKWKTFFLVYCVIILLGALITKFILMGPYVTINVLIDNKMVADALIIILLGMSCSSYNLYATLDEKLKKDKSWLEDVLERGDI